MNKLTVMCTTRDEHRLISIGYKKECVEILISHGRTYQRTNSHNNYSAHLRVVQYYKRKLNSTVESICEYILDEYVPVRTVPELIVGEVGQQSNSYSCIPVASEC